LTDAPLAGGKFPSASEAGGHGHGKCEAIAPAANAARAIQDERFCVHFLMASMKVPGETLDQSQFNG
jgi:hypothetical protein